MMLPEKDQRVLEHILRYCDKIQETVRRFGSDREVFLADPDYRDSVSMNLLQIGELAGKLSPQYAQATKAQMDWRAIRNMRNMFAHDYGSMDLDMIWNTVAEDIPCLMDFCRSEIAD